MKNIQMPFVILLIFQLAFLFDNSYQLTNLNHSEKILDLIAEPDYRAIQLKWNYPKSELKTRFRIRYCEITSWNSKNRCKEQLVYQSSKVNNIKEHLDSDDAVIDLYQPQPQTYEASLTNLRMLTNYSITIWPVNNSNQYISEVVNNLKSDSSIFVETKSFSARTSKCLANSSEIEVQTGPYFKGKISVEGANNAECAVYGNRTSKQNLYKFVINNEACGSRLMNNSRIETMVIVHENKEILTHNSRRYLVICTFHPEIHSLTASVSVPSHLLKKVFERLSDKNFQLTAAKKQTRNKMKRFSQSAATATLKQQSIYSSTLQPLRDSRALSSNSGEQQDQSSGKLISSPPLSSLFLSRSQSFSSSQVSSQSLALLPITSSLSARDNSSSLIDILAQHKFLLSSLSVVFLCLSVSIYLLVSHYRCSRSHYPHESIHHHGYRHQKTIQSPAIHQQQCHSYQKQPQQQHHHHLHHKHHLSPQAPFDKRRRFDSLESTRTDSSV